MAWTRDEAKKLAEQVFAYSKAPECEVWLDASEAGHTRFAANDVTTSGSARDLTVAIASRGNGRTGTVRVNDTDAAALKTRGRPERRGDGRGERRPGVGGRARTAEVSGHPGGARGDAEGRRA